MELAEVGLHCRHAVEELDNRSVSDRERLCRVWFHLARVAPAIDGGRLPGLSPSFDRLWVAFGPVVVEEPFRSPIQIIWNEFSPEDLERCERMTRAFAGELHQALKERAER
jgi:hypothetical protein